MEPNQLVKLCLITVLVTLPATLPVTASARDDGAKDASAIGEAELGSETLTVVEVEESPELKELQKELAEATTVEAAE